MSSIKRHITLYLEFQLLPPLFRLSHGKRKIDGDIAPEI
jgi:hypothetical protein